MSLPYVLKADVVKVVINKIESEPKTYRYRGSIFSGKDIVKYVQGMKRKQNFIPIQSL